MKRASMDRKAEIKAAILVLSVVIAVGAVLGLLCRDSVGHHRGEFYLHRVRGRAQGRSGQRPMGADGLMEGLVPTRAFWFLLLHSQDHRENKSLDEVKTCLALHPR